MGKCSVFVVVDVDVVVGNWETSTIRYYKRIRRLAKWFAKSKEVGSKENFSHSGQSGYQFCLP